MSARDPLFGCLIASGRQTRDGYVHHGKTLAHLHAWREVHGEIPEGMEVDHRCRRKACVAMHHLELVTHGENQKRKFMRHRMKWKCPDGHEWPLNRAVTDQGGVTCRQCNREAKENA
jgi:hypothetical protein